MTTETLETIISRTRAKPQGDRQWQGHCPYHDDTKPSLSIGLGDNGRILLTCHAGCETPAIVKSMGLGMADLFLKANGKRRIVATYDYMDADGGLLFQTVRYAPKGFKQRRPNGSGGWAWNLKGTRRILYRLPEVLATKPGDLVFVAEGEKSADAVRALGLVATTSPLGAKKWPNGGTNYTEPLRGRRVAILPDNDDAGYAHALDAANSLYGIAAKVGIVELPELPDGGDVCDWLAIGGDRDKLLALAEGALRTATTNRRKTRWTVDELLDAEFPDPPWTVPGLIPVGLVFLAGRPKVGKSWLALQIAHAVGTGGMVLDQKVEPGKVFFIAFEDSRRRLQARTKTQGVPRTARITFETEWRKLPDGGLVDLQAEIEREHHTLVIIDTLTRAVGRADQRDPVEMTFIIGTLQEMAIKYDITLLILDHHRKPTGMMADPIDDIMESTAKAAVADAALGLYKEKGKRGAILKVVGRDVEEKELALEWDGLLCCWQLVGEAGKVKKATLKADILEAIRHLVSMGEMPSTTNIAQHLGKNTGNVSHALADLLGSGEVVKGQRERRMQPYLLPGIALDP